MCLFLVSNSTAKIKPTKIKTVATEKQRMILPACFGKLSFQPPTPCLQRKPHTRAAV